MIDCSLLFQKSTMDPEQTQDKDNTTAENSQENTEVKSSGLEEVVKKERQAAAAAKKEAADLRRQLAALDGIDPAEYTKLKTAQQEAERRKLEETGQYQELIQRKDLEITEAKTKAAEALARANQELSRASLTMAFTRADGNPELLGHFLKIVGDLPIGEDGKPVIPTVVLESGDEIKDLGEYVKYVRDNDPAMGYYFKPLNKAAGSGDTGARNPGAGTPATVSVAQMGDYLTEIAAGTVVVKG
jgi:hypothetical protein